MNCELMLTYDTPALWQTGSRNLTGQQTLPTIWGTYMTLLVLPSFRPSVRPSVRPRYISSHFSQ
jgi:hypothetical protein